MSAPLASESCHWYDPGGDPCYEQPMKAPGKNGNTARGTTLADAKKLAAKHGKPMLAPSVTTIIRAAAAPGLELWKRSKCIMAALTATREPGEEDDDFCDRIAEEAAAEARDAADWGTAMHAAMEAAITGKPYDPALKRHIEGALSELRQGAPAWWHSENSFTNSEHGFAGKVDLHSVDPAWVVDLKGKEFYPETARLAWDEHGMQLAAYRLGLGLTGARCANLFVSRSVPGLARLHVWTPKESERHEAMFLALLRFWELDKGYSARGI